MKSFWMKNNINNYLSILGIIVLILVILKGVYLLEDFTNPLVETNPDSAASYPAGQYQVGIDLDAGLYILEGDGYFSICTAVECDVKAGEMIYNDNFKNRAYLDAKENQFINVVGDIKIIPLASYEHVLDSTITEDGYYLVGSDIEPNIYQLSGSGYYSICTTPTCDISNGELLEHHHFEEEEFTIEVKDSKFLIIKNLKVTSSNLNVTQI